MAVARSPVGLPLPRSPARPPETRRRRARRLRPTRRTDPPCRRRGPYKPVLAQHSVLLKTPGSTLTDEFQTSSAASFNGALARSFLRSTIQRRSCSHRPALHAAQTVREENIAIRFAGASQPTRSTGQECRFARPALSPSPSPSTRSSHCFRRCTAEKTGDQTEHAGGRCSARLTSSSFSEMPARGPTVSKGPSSR
jgi:hypothetical protein